MLSPCAFVQLAFLPSSSYLVDACQTCLMLPVAMRTLLLYPVCVPGICPAPAGVTPFWRALSRASVDADGCLKLPAGTWFMGNRDFGSAIYIRDCYCNLMEQINNLVAAGRVQRVVITGTPGIGKTCYAFYWLWHLCQTGRTVVYQLGPDWYRFCGAIAVQGSRKAFLAAGYLDDPAAWYLSDPAESKKPYSWFGGITLFFAAPCRACYHEFLKAPAATKRFMPVWSEEELLRCAELLFSGQDPERDVPQARVRELFRQWGGVPRYVLQCAHDDEQQGTLAAAIHHCSVGDLQAAIRSGGEGMGATNVLSDKLVHIHTCDAFTSKRLMWASDYVFDEFCSAQEKSLRQQLAAFLAASAEVPILAVRGLLYKPMVHRVFGQGEKFACKVLGGDSGASFPHTWTFHTTERFSKLADVQVQRGVCYILPNSWHLPCCSALVRASWQHSVHNPDRSRVTARCENRWARQHYWRGAARSPQTLGCVGVGHAAQ
eukprot:TRINITY_DN286_c2_g1_i1.p1 TRINITY_DN286_c2_g1~~TRINITY_DN286_c2_g1_i1.p1  ORF type:complete len:488 (-),score=63.29 TRINITY_DN286_c2_g1_i1:153-1616(-)